jgi:hydroxyethylthiazole kinase-like uncharacterized protein yjeF
MSPMPLRVDDAAAAWPLHGVDASRRIEQAASSALPVHTLMQRAGLVVARWTLALAPHARRILVAAGPGNNGGDGFEAAMHLHSAGREVQVVFVGDAARLPSDAAASLARALAAGVTIIDRFEAAGPAPDVVIDALLGLGASRAPGGTLAAAIDSLNQLSLRRLAIDLPSGLSADSGTCAGAVVQATHTLALLTLKPGLFTGRGRELAGELWFDDLGVDAANAPPAAFLFDPSLLARLTAPRGHAGHKGTFGDVIALGGAPGMSGALALATRAASTSGAGRVFACALDGVAPGYDAAAPELMWRPGLWREHPQLLDSATVLAGCGGGAAIAAALPMLLSRSARLVLDADALNAIAVDSALQHLLATRATRALSTVLTPHPLEAARLLGHADAQAVQANRLVVAGTLAQRFAATVVLKGSGSVIAHPGAAPVINPSGNARLASAGSGDVLAGMVAGLWSAAPHGSSFETAQVATFLHGKAADADAPTWRPLTASALLARLAAL